MAKSRRLVYWMVLLGGLACGTGEPNFPSGDGGAVPGGNSGSGATGGPLPGNGGSGGQPAPAEAREVIKRPPFPPRDFGHLSRLFYPQGPEEQAAPAPGPDGTAVKTLLAETLGRRPALGQTVVAETVALFEDPELVRMVPAASLRAALLLLRGTAGDAAIAAITDGAFAGVRFGAGDPCCPNTAAWVEGTGALGTIVVVDWAQYDDPRALAAVLAHESLHRDIPVNTKEEAICSAIEAVIYGQLVLESPDIARLRTRLTRGNNTRLMERLNSRDETGQLRLVYSSGYTLPRSQAGYGFMIEFYQPFTGNTPGDATLGAMVEAVTGTRPANPAFDNPTVELLDQRQTVLGPEDIVALALALDLELDPAADVPAPARPASQVGSAPPPATPGEAAALQILRQPPFAPTNVALFDRAAYPNGPPDRAAGGPRLDAAGARDVLQTTLTTRFGAEDPRLQSTLALFDGPKLGAAIPEPAFRAALLCLRGTVADTVVEAMLAGVFSGIVEAPTVPELPFAWVMPPEPEQRPRLTINGSVGFEDPRLLAPFLAEAGLQEDAVKTPKELLVGRALAPLVYAQLLLEAPALAKTGTALSRVSNRVLLGRLNSRDAEGRLRLLDSTGNVYPNSAGVLPSYLGPFIPYGPDTPGGRGLWDMVSAATRMPGFEGAYSVSTVRLLDERQGLLSAEQIVTLARILELDLP